MPCRVGVQLPEVERAVPWAEIVAMARAAEHAGFDSIWLGDHLLYDLVGAENLVHGHAASVYSWMTPPVRSCRRTRKASRAVTGAGVALRGAAWLRDRCGRCSL
jgi:alkanesulfonate monooxygenase SsuD/methylene tetrahydromethanopterin reductase-like flavin-dependent oxidoreductase (luciferase family)